MTGFVPTVAADQLHEPLNLASNEGGKRMALIPCPECNRQISDKAAVCPQCGHPITAAPQNETRQGTHSEALPQSFDPAPAQTRPGLSLKGRIWFGLLFFIIPYACVLVSSTLYYAWRKEKPAQARQINILGFVVFGLQILFTLIMALVG